MRILVSYFYHVRHFKPYMIPFSTAVWDPTWYHNFNKCHNYTYLDKNGVLNGLRMPLLKPGQKCKGLCSGKELCQTLFGKTIPDECLFLKEYKAQLERLDFESVKATLEGQARFVKECLGFKEEPIIVLLVHEAPNNPCSERWALKDWFLNNGYILEEYDQKNFEEENYESND